ncbi:MAG: hypothetical protein IKG80_00075, partial [Clostridia bacterium]|nr:hypothetical protein [Clostridia bacterium]
MSKPMKKGVKITLILLIVIVLLIACFISVAIYARIEFQKERTWFPPEFSPQQASVTELPDNIHDAYTYVMKLYNETVNSDVTEGSWHTDVDLGGDVGLPFREADKKVFDEIRSETAGMLRALYPDINSVKMSEEDANEVPEVNLEESEILEYIYDPAAIFNRKGEYNSNTYELVFKVSPAFEKTEDILQSDVYKAICEELKDALTINSAKIDVKEVEIRFRVDRLTDQLLSVEIMRFSDVTADVTLTEAYSALLENGDRLTVTLPYRATEHIDFMWYGLRFTDDFLEQKPNDITPLPLDVHVNGAAVRGEDFDIEFEISHPETLTIDDDLVMTINRVNDISGTEGVTITATLLYEGKTWSDDLTVYITEMDKTTTGVRFWKDSYTIAYGSTEPLPVEIRVPVNEQSEQRTEEEYELIVDV